MHHGLHTCTYGDCVHAGGRLRGTVYARNGWQRRGTTQLPSLLNTYVDEESDMR